MDDLFTPLLYQNFHGVPAYYYEGQSARLPRTPQVEAMAKILMQHLSMDERFSTEGKMYGVLLVEDQHKVRSALKAFSGLLLGERQVEGWVPMIPGRDEVKQEETQIVAQLASMKDELIALQDLPERRELASLAQEFSARYQALVASHAENKAARDKERQTSSGEALRILERQSQQEGIARRDLRRERDEALLPLQKKVQQADNKMQAMKRARAEISRQLQAKMNSHYRLTNFTGSSLPLRQLMPGGIMPTGTGECCAPKLLHYAAAHGLRPLAMAEFWWGPTLGDKTQGLFYGACAERCQPLIGFLLSGLSQEETTHSLSILYEDGAMIAVNKPAGLLSVPGRYHDNQDSVLSRLRLALPDGESLTAVHRLDQDTSGVLLLAKDATTHSLLRQQFEQRLAHKIYEAVLVGALQTERGAVVLPLWGDPENRPYQVVDHTRGKPSTTKFKVLSRDEGYTRVELYPDTGRTHQLRVHASSKEGLDAPIKGDRLYSTQAPGARLHLHARELRVTHPNTKELLRFFAETPF